MKNFMYRILVGVCFCMLMVLGVSNIHAAAGKDPDKFVFVPKGQKAPIETSVSVLKDLLDLQKEEVSLLKEIRDLLKQQAE